MIEFVCDGCKCTFTKLKYEYERNIRMGRSNFHSHSCYAIYHNKKFPGRGNVGLLNPANKRDEFSPFRNHLRVIKQHAKYKNREASITLQDLKNQWDMQNGVCPYTGWDIYNPSTSQWKKQSKNMKKASVDRIDNRKGYVTGNIQFVSMIANFAKNNFSDQELIEFCKAVTKNMEV
mgnify:CR=1 FL=1